MKKNSWIYQWGVLNILGTPFLLQGGKKDGMAAVGVAVVLSLGFFFLQYLWGQKNQLLRKVAEPIIAAIGFIMSVYGIISVATWYSDAITKKWQALVLAVVVLLIGNGRGDRGRESMASVWSKIMLPAVLAVLLFQIPGKSFVFQWPEDSLNIGNVLSMGGLLFLINLPFYLASFGERENMESKKRGVLRLGLMWSGYFCTILLLMGMWEMEILQMAPFPYLLLGQTGTTFSGEGVRLETLNFVVIIVSLYFAAGGCLDRLRTLCRDENTKRRGKSLAIMISIGLLTGFFCTGCGSKLAEKQLVLIGDEIQLKEGKKETEYSCTKLLVIHDDSFEELLPYLLNQPNLSYEIYVAYSLEPIEEELWKIMEEMNGAEAMKYVEELTESGTGTGLGEYVTIREFINKGIKKESVLLPVIEIRDGQLGVSGLVLYKNK